MNKKITLLALIISTTVYPQKIALLSIPKCGTHLLTRCMELLLERRFYAQASNWIVIEDQQTAHDLFLSHATYTTENIKQLEQNNFKAIFIYRDPRDQAVSLAHFVRYSYKHLWPQFNNVDLIKVMELWIRDTSLFTPVTATNKATIKLFGNLDDYYQRFLPWINQPYVYATTFEKLVGSRGGGSDEQQFIEIQNIVRHLGLSISDQKIKTVVAKLFGNTGTFRAGQIGSWKTAFTPDMKNLAKQTLGNLLIELGYENDLDW